jgi:hypothetical protein
MSNGAVGHEESTIETPRATEKQTQENTKGAAPTPKEEEGDEEARAPVEWEEARHVPGAVTNPTQKCLYVVQVPGGIQILEPDPFFFGTTRRVPVVFRCVLRGSTREMHRPRTRLLADAEAAVPLFPFAYPLAVWIHFRTTGLRIWPRLGSQCLRCPPWGDCGSNNNTA